MPSRRRCSPPARSVDPLASIVAEQLGDLDALDDLGLTGERAAAEYVAANHASLGNGVHVLPEELDKQIARLKLLVVEDWVPPLR